MKTEEEAADEITRQYETAIAMLADILEKGGYPDTPGAAEAAMHFFVEECLEHGANPKGMMEDIARLIAEWKPSPLTFTIEEIPEPHRSKLIEKLKDS